MKDTIIERLTRLREGMRENQMDFYLIPTADYHDSEYVSDFFKIREYYSGFTGSNGTLVVWDTGAGLWTDGRYFVQAEMELEGTTIKLFRMQMEGVPTIRDFLKARMQSGQTLGFYGKSCSASYGENLQKDMEEIGCQIAYTKDVAGSLWENRPPFPCSKVLMLPNEVAGKSVRDKLTCVRQAIAKQKAEALFLSKLDDIMWLFNLRGSDVECNPVAMSHAYITMEDAVVYLQPEVADSDVLSALAKEGVSVGVYGQEITQILNRAEHKILVDHASVSFYSFQKLLETKKLITVQNPTLLLKAVKNETELTKMREYYLLDNVAVTKFIYWLKNKADIETITEFDAALYLDSLRSEIPGFMELSFPTISAYDANAAMMHYEATKEQASKLGKKGFLLVDSGGQYMGATTDITRTISLGPLEGNRKRDYTLTLLGMLKLSKAVFLQGCTGRNLDILARGALWEQGIDYLCGTGHGVGYILNVHEGPHSIRWRYNEALKETPLEPGMCVTDEPGVYMDGEYGIRIENVLVVKQREKNKYGQFLEFETLTYVPFDRDSIDVSLLNEQSRQWINAYQKTTFEKLAPYLTNEELMWLESETKPL